MLLCGGADATAGGRKPANPCHPRDWAAGRTAAEELLEAVRCSATAADTALAGYLIASLDERGFLPGGPEQLAADLAIPVARVQRAVELVRCAGPSAIAARDVRESLLLQLDALNPADPLRDLARAIADQHLEPLASGRLAAVAASLGRSRDDIAAAVAYIKRHCTPSPAPELRAPAAEERVPVVPDVLITVTGAGLRVEMVEQARLGLRVDPWYQGLAAREAEHEVQEHAASLVQRAASFISRLEDRFAAMRQVVEYAAERQREFVVRGPRYLRPLAQADVARDLAIHESTVSRAVAGKYMMLPSRDVVPVQDFFRPALAPQDALRKLVAAEREPLTDTELAQRLRAQGFPLARRTVAKYRHALGIAAAPLRS